MQAWTGLGFTLSPWTVQNAQLLPLHSWFTPSSTLRAPSLLHGQVFVDLDYLRNVLELYLIYNSNFVPAVMQWEVAGHS